MAKLIRFLLLFGLLSVELCLHARAQTCTDLITDDCDRARCNAAMRIKPRGCITSPTFTVPSNGFAVEVVFKDSGAQTTTGPLLPGMTLGVLRFIGSFTSFDQRTLEGIQGLTILYIINNDGLSSLPDDFFDGSGSTGAPRGAAITELHMMGNALTNVDRIGISSLTSLRHLDLQSNQIESLSETLFSGLASLTYLRLKDNRISALPANIFRGLVSLQELTLHNNSLTVLPADTFRGLVSLRILRLSHNRISALPPDIFRGLASLQELYLHNNSLTVLPADTFRGLVSLHNLTLAENSLSALPTDIFTGLVSLWRLTLGNNRIPALPIHIFRDLISLKSLWLGQNSISCLSSTVFAPLRSLTELGLTQTVSPRGICAQTFKGQTDFTLYFGGMVDKCAIIDCSGGTVTERGGLTKTSPPSCDCDSNEGCTRNCERDCLEDAPLGTNMQHGEGCLDGAVETSYCQNQCNDGYGYEIPWADVPSIQCVKGQWMPGTLNDCVENSCPQPAPFGENMIRGTSNCDANTASGSTCQHTCVTGYTLPESDDPPPITCQLGTWSSSSIESCIPILCDAAAPIDQGTMTTGSNCGAGSAEGAVCQQTCKSGLEYTVGAGDQPPAIECRSGEWTLSLLSPCTAILCRTPAPLADNMIMGLVGCDVNSDLGSTCQHSCVNGFQYEGNDNPPPISCTNGTWNPASISSCTVTTCVNSAPIDANTMMIGPNCEANQEHGFICQNTCNTGLEYTIDAGDQPPALECVSGTWSTNTLAACTVKRCKTPAPFNANMIMGSTNCNIDTPDGSTCNHTCIAGFNYEGADNPPDITCLNGKWEPSSVLPCSVILCLNAAPIDHTTMNQGSNCTTNQEHGIICQHTCKDGLEYTSNSGLEPPPLQCLSGTWSPNTIHPCMAKVCKVPAPFADNMIVGDSGCDIDSPEGATCQHTCKNGFVYPSTTMNPPPISCIRGAWNPATIMSCIVTTCVNSAPIDANTMMIGPNCEANQEHGAICKQTCNTGLEYTIDAEDQPPAVICLFGTWSPAILTPCTVKRCKSPAPFGDNMVRGDLGCGINTSGGSTCQHSCKTGYYFPEADSPPEITCSNGEWSPATIESCMIYDCGPRPTAANTRQVATTGTTYEDTTTYECIGLTYAPYNATTQTIVCNELGQWTALYACTGGITSVRLTLDQKYSPALADETSTEYLTLCKAFHSHFVNVIPQSVTRFHCKFRENEWGLVVSLAPVGEEPLSLLEETQNYLGIQNSITSDGFLMKLVANQPAVTVTNMELVRITQNSAGMTSEILLDITEACALYNFFQVCKCKEREGMPECLTNNLYIWISPLVGLLALIFIVMLVCCLCGGGGRRRRLPRQPIELQPSIPIVFTHVPRAYYRPRTPGAMPGPVIRTIRQY